MYTSNNIFVIENVKQGHLNMANNLICVYILSFSWQMTHNNLLTHYISREEPLFVIN